MRLVGGGRRLVSLAIVLWIPVWLGCASLAPPSPLDFFRPVPQEDTWRLKIRAWQAAAHLSSLEPNEEISDPTPLAEEYLRFSSEFRLEIVQRVLRWVQAYSGLYYRSDNGVDHWPTLDELIEQSVGLAQKRGLVKKGDKIVVVTGQPVGKRENMNLVEVQTV